MKRVLVADDTKNIRTLICKCLQIEGYQAIEAADGRQALDMLDSGTFDLAFLDIKMPQMSGTEVLKAIRAAGIGTPVIIITAYATVKNAVECTQMGAVAYLHKPFTADKLRNVLSEFKQADGLPVAERLINLGKPQEALPILKKLLSDDPLDGAVYLVLARACERLGKNEDANKYMQIHNLLKKS